MPTNLWLALITSSLHRIADHCKRYEVTSAEGAPGGYKSAHPAAILRSSGIATWTMRKCRICQHKLLSMLWLRSKSHREMGLPVPQGSPLAAPVCAACIPKRKCKTLHFMSKICNYPLKSSIAWLQDIAQPRIAYFVMDCCAGLGRARTATCPTRDIESVRSWQPSPTPNRENGGREATEASQRQVHKVRATLGNLAAVSAPASVPVAAPLLAVVSVAAPMVSGAESENEYSGCRLAQKDGVANLSVDHGLAKSARG
jgi:hypothetical protein